MLSPEQFELAKKCSKEYVPLLRREDYDALIKAANRRRFVIPIFSLPSARFPCVNLVQVILILCLVFLLGLISGLYLFH